MSNKSIIDIVTIDIIFEKYKDTVDFNEIFKRGDGKSYLCVSQDAYTKMVDVDADDFLIIFAYYFDLYCPNND
jgi:hypothetical protein